MAEASWRIKPDTSFMLSDGSQPKYLSRVGDKARAYFPHTTKLELLADCKASIVITEGEYKTLEGYKKVRRSDDTRRYKMVLGVVGYDR